MEIKVQQQLALMIMSGGYYSFVVDDKNQDKKTLVKTNSIKSCSSMVAWTELTTDDDIIL